MFSLERLYLYLSWRCNLLCRHCWVSSGDGDNVIMTKDIVSKSVEESIELGLKLIKLSGGEPFLFPDLVVYVTQLCKKYDLQLNIETNGTLLNPELSDILAQTSAFVNVSIDSHDEQTHNGIRCNHNAYRAAFDGIALLSERRIPLSVTHTISENNIKFLDDLIQALSSKGVKNLKLNPILNLGRAQQNPSDFPYALPVSEYEQIVRKYHGQVIDGVSISIMVPPCFLSVPELITKKKLPMDCGYLNQLSVLPDGTVGLCGEAKDLDAFKYGNITQNTMRDIWIDSLTLNRMRDEVQKGLKGVCSCCNYKELCAGGCRIAAYLYQHEYCSPHPYAEAYFQQHEKLPFSKAKIQNF